MIRIQNQNVDGGWSPTIARHASRQMRLCLFLVVARCKYDTEATPRPFFDQSKHNIASCSTSHNAQRQSTLVYDFYLTLSRRHKRKQPAAQS